MPQPRMLGPSQGRRRLEWHEDLLAGQSQSQRQRLTSDGARASESRRLGSGWDDAAFRRYRCPRRAPGAQLWCEREGGSLRFEASFLPAAGGLNLQLKLIHRQDISRQSLAVLRHGSLLRLDSRIGTTHSTLLNDK